MRDTTLLEALPFPRLKELDIREIVIHPFQREAADVEKPLAIDDQRESPPPYVFGARAARWNGWITISRISSSFRRGNGRASSLSLTHT